MGAFAGKTKTSSASNSMGVHCFVVKCSMRSDFFYSSMASFRMALFVFEILALLLLLGEEEVLDGLISMLLFSRHNNNITLSNWVGWAEIIW